MPTRTRDETPDDDERPARLVVEEAPPPEPPNSPDKELSSPTPTAAEDETLRSRARSISSVDDMLTKRNAGTRYGENRQGDTVIERSSETLLNYQIQELPVPDGSRLHNFRL
jgi:hypothetical protein